MVTAFEGWAVSYDGLILKFDGQFWEISDSLQRFEMAFSPEVDTLLTDLTSWGDIYTIRMVDSIQGWIAVNNPDIRIHLLFQFIDNRWRPWPRPFPIKLRALDFLGRTFGIGVGDGGGYSFQNGYWEVLQLPMSIDFRTVKIVAPQHIFIAGERGIILKGGKDWAILESPSSALIRDMDFVSPEEGWLVGNSGTILHYQAGTLKKENSPTRVNLWAIDMLSPDFGFIVGEQGIILQYNGGTWKIFPTPTRADLHDIEMLDSETGWAVGAWGTILKYGLHLRPSVPEKHPFLFIDQVHLGSSNLMDRIDDVQGVTIADFNGDNRPDIYLTCYRSLNHLLLNQGGGYYVDYVIESGTGGNIETRIGKRKYEVGALAADFDRDGDTDLLLAGKRGTTRLLINNGRAIFRDGTLRSRLPKTLDLIDGDLADFNEDGYPDFVLADETVGLRIFLNRKYNRFQERLLDSLKLPHTGIRALAAADFNRDHHTDIAAFYHNFHPIILYNDGKAQWETSGKPFFNTRVSNFVNSVTVADFNNDGYHDLFLGTENGEDGLLIYNPRKACFINQSQQWGIKQEGRSYSGVAGDFDLDGDLDLFVSRFGPSFLYLNKENRSFTEVAQDAIYSKAGYLSGYNTGAAAADIDADGDLDLVVGNKDYWSSLLQNTRTSSNYISLRLVGVEDTYEALGAKIWVWRVSDFDTTRKLIAFREIIPNSGLFSQNSRDVYIGLGSLDRVNIKVRFLGGQEKRFIHIAPDTTLIVFQNHWTVRHYYKILRTFLQFLHIPRVTFELFKFAIFILLIFLSVRFIERRYNWRPSHIVLYVLVVMAIYGILTLLLSRSGGLLNHLLPFGMILFTLLVLVSVNEQIRKYNCQQNMYREHVQKASTELSRVIVVNKAISIVVKTVKLIYPYRFLIVYSYHAFGNYFLCKKADGIRLNHKHHKIVIERRKLNQLFRLGSPVPYNKFSCCFSFPLPFAEDTLVFPLVKKNEIQGIVLLGLNPQHLHPDQQVLSLLNYLFLQLTLTLSNIGMLHDMQDQQQLVAIGTFASGIIHNLKNPIDGIRMIIEILYHDTPPQDPRYEYIKELHSGIIRLKHTLVHSFDFLNYSDQSKERVFLNNLIQDIALHFQKLHYPLLQLHLDNRIPAIQGNSDQLRHALQSLIQNAFEASGGSQPVQVHTRLHKRERTIHIDVVDHGEGIPQKELDKIFDMFYSTRGSGRGLGLTITRYIIKNHGGYINIHSDSHEGTRFTIVLPYLKKEVVYEKNFNRRR